MVEPPEPAEGGELDFLEKDPRSLRSDELGFVESDHRLRQGVVVVLFPPISDPSGLT